MGSCPFLGHCALYGVGPNEKLRVLHCSRDIQQVSPKRAVAEAAAAGAATIYPARQVTLEP
jgi:hypothetical protein